MRYATWASGDIAKNSRNSRFTMAIDGSLRRQPMLIDGRVWWVLIEPDDGAEPMGVLQTLVVELVDAVVTVTKRSLEFRKVLSDLTCHTPVQCAVE